jgi:cytochrome c oxidase assembly protein subunit 15
MKNARQKGRILASNAEKGRLTSVVATLRGLVSFLGHGKWLKGLSWASLISQIALVVTGGVVRLTGSGLGCPTWPKCTDDSYVNVPEMGIHGVIEFTNRLLTFVLVVIAVATLISVLQRVKVERKGLTSLAWYLVAGIPAQAVLGGITVKTHLNPWAVGAHFLLSGIMIWLASQLVYRVYAPKSPAIERQPVFFTNWLLFAGVLTVVVGVLVTGAGPHAGDSTSVRNGLPLDILQHVHSYPAYAMLTFNLFCLGALLRTEGSVPFKQRRLATKVQFLLLVVSLYQIVLGVTQARLGVPPVLVALHLLGAASLI